jgi:hypothetical protein
MGVPEKDYAIDEIALLIVGGPVKMFVINTAGAITGGTSFIKPVNATLNGQVDGTAQTVNGIALACEDQNSAAASLINVQMLGLPAQV